jgi:hypothetical protein
VNDRIKDPALYDDLNQPFADREAANAALAKFFDGVSALRAEHGIADVYVCAEIRHLHGEDVDDIRNGVASLYRGDVMRKLPMLARAYGEARGELDELLGEAIHQGREGARRR